MSEAAVLTNIRQRREAIVLEHIDAENRCDAKATLATYSMARMDIPTFGENGQVSVHDAVHALYEGLFVAFPDFHIDVDRLRHGEDHVLVEGRLSGTQHADWAGIPNAGRRFTTRFAGVFEFENDQLVCERPYFELSDIARQLTGSAL
jgi:steroid delta-isomerase-like uncharacterized protein